MKLSVINSNNISWETNQLFIVIADKNYLSPFFKKWQKLTGNHINNIIENSNFSFKFSQSILLRSSKTSLMLLGHGSKKRSTIDYEKLGGILFSKIQLEFKKITILTIWYFR